jgi:hypothetical protein
VGDDLFSEAQKANIIGFGYYYHGVVPHREVGRYLLQADGYFLSTVIPTQAGGVLPGKLWEYLRGGKPILLFGPKDEAWETIHEAGVGFYVGQTGLDCTDLDRLLLRLTNKRRIPTPRQYSWEHRARSIEEVFRRVLLEER